MKNIIEYYKSLNKEVKLQIKTKIAFAFSIFWSIAKILMGIFSSSIFLFASALFTLALCFSKFTCLQGIKKDEKLLTKKYFIFSSMLIIISGVFYAGYSLRLLFGHIPKNYGIIVAITIATFSFYCMVNSIINLFRYKNSSPYYRTLRVISFIAALTDIMLTQMSLLIVCMPEMSQLYNVYFALGIGIITVLLGVINLRHIKLTQGK
jgi:hypothetical protein